MDRESSQGESRKRHRIGRKGYQGIFIARSIGTFRLSPPIQGWNGRNVASEQFQATLYRRWYHLPSWHTFAAVELLYRKSDPSKLQDVLDDIFNTSRCICLRGLDNLEEFKLIQNGISKVRMFIHSENYALDSAIVNASKAAYLSKLIEKGISEVHHFTPSSEQRLVDAVITEPLPTKFNKFKKSNTEAFFYWNEIQLLG